MKEKRNLGGSRQLPRLMLSQSLSTYANQVISFIIPWLILAKTGNALMAGGVAFAIGIASLLGTLAGGLVTDRIGGRRVAMLADFLSLVTALALALALSMDFFALWFVIITQVLGVFFDGPGQIARNTMVPKTAEEEKVPMERAMGIIQTLQGIAMFVGPISAGFLIGILSESWTLAIAGGLFLLSILFLFKMRRQVLVHEHPMTPKQAYRDMREAVVFIAKEPFLNKMQIMGPLYGFVMFALTLIVFPSWFVLNGQSPDALGFFLGAVAIGGMFGGGLYAGLGSKVSQHKWMVIATALYALILVGLHNLQPGAFTTVLVGFAGGLTITGVMAILYTAFYTRTPQSLLGRVNSVGSAIGSLGAALAGGVFGWVVEITSPPTAILVCAVIMGALALAALLIPSMKLLDRKPQTATPVNAPLQSQI